MIGYQVVRSRLCSLQFAFGFLGSWCHDGVGPNFGHSVLESECEVYELYAARLRRAATDATRIFGALSNVKLQQMTILRMRIIFPDFTKLRQHFPLVCCGYSTEFMRSRRIGHVGVTPFDRRYCLTAGGAAHCSRQTGAKRSVSTLSRGTVSDDGRRRLSRSYRMFETRQNGGATTRRGSCKQHQVGGTKWQIIVVEAVF